MRKEKKYGIVVAVLAVIIILQWIFILSGRRRLPRPPPKAPPAPVVALKAKIAIVLDDWGYNLNNVAGAGRIKYPITAAVLPNLAYSRRVSRELHRAGLEIILHLPLEPHEKVRLEKDTIMIGMDENAVKGILDRDLSGIEYVKGASGHMGSLATEDPVIMGIIFKDLKNRRLYFLDSFVSAKSVCAATAKQAGLAFARRSVFLDNQLDPAYIRKQIYQLKTKARINGQAIGIGHDRKATLEVLREVMPQLEKEGYKFVYVSELTK